MLEILGREKIIYKATGLKGKYMKILNPSMHSGGKDG